MIWTSFARERNIRRVLRSLAGNRVVAILNPGNVWVIENAPTDYPDYQEALSTCLIRGWIEVLHEAIPQGKLGADALPNRTQPFQSSGSIYRVTDSGWAVINRTHTWVLATFAVALLALVATTIQLWRQ